MEELHKILVFQAFHEIFELNKRKKPQYTAVCNTSLLEYFKTTNVFG